MPLSSTSRLPAGPEMTVLVTVAENVSVVVVENVDTTGLVVAVVIVVVIVSVSVSANGVSQGNCNGFWLIFDDFSLL